MGIPHYFKKIAARYPGVVASRPPAGGCARLFLDMNSLVHPVAQRVADAAGRRPVPPDGAALTADIVDSVVVAVRGIAESCPPREMLYLAVDGVPPLAKIAQQRRRRFVGVLINAILGPEGAPSSEGGPDSARSGSGPALFDRNAISPGTEFMAELTRGLARFAEEEDAKGGGGPAVVVSGSDEEGEGEHKIYEMLRSERAFPAAKGGRAGERGPTSCTAWMPT